MKKLNYIIIGFLILIILGIVAFGYSKRAKYIVDVNITPEEKAQYEAKVAEYDKHIKEVMAPDRPDIDFFIEKSRYQEYLGRYGDAIDTLLESFKYYQNTSAGWNNIAKLYEKVGDYKSAIIFYNKLISTFSLYRYYLDIAWDYYKLGKFKVAFEAYGRYAQFTGQTDSELLQLLTTKMGSKK